MAVPRQVATGVKSLAARLACRPNSAASFLATHRVPATCSHHRADFGVKRMFLAQLGYRLWSLDAKTHANDAPLPRIRGLGLRPNVSFKRFSEPTPARAITPAAAKQQQSSKHCLRCARIERIRRHSFTCHWPGSIMCPHVSRRRVATVN
eukprot:355236-Chlamydomonas_euryale.AAC.6